MGAPLGPAECVVHLGRSYPREDPSCSGPVPTAKTTLNPAHVRPERRALHNEPRLDDTIKPLHSRPSMMWGEGESPTPVFNTIHSEGRPPKPRKLRRHAGPLPPSITRPPYAFPPPFPHL